MQNTLFRPSAVRESRQKFNPEGFDLAAAVRERQAAVAAGQSADVEFKDLDSIPGYKTSAFLASPVEQYSWVQNYQGRAAAAAFPVARFSQPVTLFEAAAGETIEAIIRAAYKQVFGNAHLMDAQRSLTAESRLKDGQLTVRGFVRELAYSAAYRDLFFERCSNLRAIELNFKHLLGRSPDSFQEMSDHIAILVNDGFEAEIDSYIDSAEYAQNFGLDTVPYYVGYATQTGKSNAGYNRILQLMKGQSSSDRSIASTITSSQRSQLQQSLLKG
ncbi:phycobilisome rod-core linker polypeptide [filamentous cyanobacterium LEGE 11480]|uniref:Phycobilisome rod-core linker polypeptide n=2 Tax=Romeriopsis TaxID=2992131 RepID=A0A928VIG7_9CYAN|nr:phycobilisome rod-core linker polypeptide [Romeriopsis navalis LEGE 11480]